MKNDEQAVCPECGSDIKEHRGLMPSEEEWCYSVRCKNEWHCTGKAPVDDIREAILARRYSEFEIKDLNRDLKWCKSSMVTQLESEIERLKKKIPIVSVDRSEICFDGKGYTEDEQIERLKAENESLRCCGNCALLAYEYDPESMWLCNNWQPKENN